MNSTASAPFAVASSPSGERVAVAERSVHVKSWGSSQPAPPGQPAIWLENGWFGQLLGWHPLPEMLEQGGWRVRAYDRGNYGWSHGATADRSAAAAAVEFAALLAALGETEPVLIIAWSGGGLVARCFAAAWPERVAGLILLDAIPPASHDAPEPDISQRHVTERSAQIARIRAIAARAETNTLREADIAEFIEAQTRERYGEHYVDLLLHSAAHWRTYAAEMADLNLSSEQARVRPLPPSTPLSALIADQPPLERIEDPDERALAAGWRARQEEAAAGNFRYVAAGHAIHRDAPQAVQAALREMRPHILRPHVMRPAIAG